MRTLDKKKTLENRRRLGDKRNLVYIKGESRGDGVRRSIQGEEEHRWIKGEEEIRKESNRRIHSRRN